MDIEQLKCAIAVVKYQTFLDAAAELNRSQSSVSKSIQKLEQELGLPIFERTTRNVRITPFGEEFISHAERIVNEYAGILSTAKDYLSEIPQKLRIGSIYFGADNGIIPMIAEFMRWYPNIEITMEESTTTPLVQKLERKELDIIFVSSMYLENGVRHNFSQDDKYYSFTMSTDPYYVVVNEEHPLAERKILSYQDIEQEAFITTDSTMDVYHRALREVFEEEKHAMKIAMQCSSIRSVLQMVSQGVGIAILSRVVTEEVDNLKLIPLNNPLIRETQMVIMRKKKTSPEIRKFWEFVSGKVKEKS